MAHRNRDLSHKMVMKTKRRRKVYEILTGKVNNISRNINGENTPGQDKKQPASQHEFAKILTNM